MSENQPGNKSPSQHRLQAMVVGQTTELANSN